MVGWGASAQAPVGTVLLADTLEVLTTEYQVALGAVNALLDAALLQLIATYMHPENIVAVKDMCCCRCVLLRRIWLHA